LYIISPSADRYAVFQDDFIMYSSTRNYLEACEWKEKTYLNLYTFPHNLLLAKGEKGWFPSDQMGRGAVALIFDLQGVTDLLGSEHMVTRPQSVKHGWRKVDGGISEALCRKKGYTELVHNPSLTQHTGLVSSMSNSQHLQADSFRGEQFDARELIQK